jgi:hypothetical protein
MHRSQPNLRSEASPRTCALECQKTRLPSGCSNGRSSSLQLFSSGRSRSHSVSPSDPLSRRAMTVRSNKLLLIPRAMSAGLVTQDSPSLMLPSSSVISIFSICAYAGQRGDTGDFEEVSSYRGVSGRFPRRTWLSASRCRSVSLQFNHDDYARPTISGSCGQSTPVED